MSYVKEIIDIYRQSFQNKKNYTFKNRNVDIIKELHKFYLWFNSFKPN